MEAIRCVDPVFEPVEGTSPLAALRLGLASIEAGLDSLGSVDDAEWDALEAAEFAEITERLEQTRRSVDAASVTAARRLQRSNPFSAQGFLSPRTVLQHLLQVSGAEAHRRLQTARLHERLPDWQGAAHDGTVGVAQCELMARVIANPRIEDEVVQRDQHQLLADARELPYDQFERNVRTWEALADPTGDRSRNDHVNDTRDVVLRGRRGRYGWTLDGVLPESGGAEVMEVLAHYIEAEWHSDWHDARQRLGDLATVADLVRTEPQRRADALVAMARAAASIQPGARRPIVTLNVLVDDMTFEATLAGGHVDPSRYRDVICRTQRGRRMHPDDAINAGLVGYVRRVVYDSAGVVVELGRRSRLFRGGAKDSVMLLADRCAWIACDRPIDWCEADHSLGWKAHGATVPRNGQPLCPSHNRLKERGFQVFRDDHGTWHVIDPDGNEIHSRGEARW